MLIQTLQGTNNNSQIGDVLNLKRHLDDGNTIGHSKIITSLQNRINRKTLKAGVLLFWHMGFHDLSLLIYFNAICIYLDIYMTS